MKVEITSDEVVALLCMVKATQIPNHPIADWTKEAANLCDTRDEPDDNLLTDFIETLLARVTSKSEKE